MFFKKNKYEDIVIPDWSCFERGNSNSAKNRRKTCQLLEVISLPLNKKRIKYEVLLHLECIKKFFATPSSGVRQGRIFSLL
mmetsp:Transcript_9806/g.13539  ORF Transcript_9806/g.13539 Transcript_9806/m.13539 type:complete len:81 (+) Transcript_9806:123-365(+)